MQSHIFDNTDYHQQDAKAQLKQIPLKSNEMAAMLCHNDGRKAEELTNKPTVNKINYTDLAQKKELSDYAKVYNARRNSSSITFI